MNPLQDITNKVNRSVLEPEDELLNEMEVLSFSPRSLASTPSTISSPSSPHRFSFPLRDVHDIALPLSERSQRRSLASSINSSSTDRRMRFPPRPATVFLKSSSCEISEISSCDDDSNEEDDVFSSNDSLNNNNKCTCSVVAQQFYPHKNVHDFKPKRKRASLPASLDQSKVFKKLHPLSKNQLVDLVYDVSKIYIGKQLVDESEPMRRLTTLLKNISKAMPDRVYGLRRDAVSFKRIEVHILLFKQECLKQCRSMFESSQWMQLFEYLTTSSRLVKDLPIWENTSHNLHREQLFRVMTSYCRKILKLASFDSRFHPYIKNRLSDCSAYHGTFTKLFQDAEKLLEIQN